jgi:uncharacterized protein
VKILPLYAALLAILFVALSVRTLLLRRRLKIGLGDAGNEVMLRAMRVHSNFAEYVPFGLLMIHLVEMQGAPAWRLHAWGVALLVGRLSHAWGVSRSPEKFVFRVVGMTLTFTTLLSCATYLLMARL